MLFEYLNLLNMCTNKIFPNIFYGQCIKLLIFMGSHCWGTCSIETRKPSGDTVSSMSHRKLRHSLSEVWNPCFHYTGSTAGYRRALCPILSCPDAPEHCRQVFNYGWISNKWCPVSCQPVCECPTPAPWDLRHCGNRDPYCRVYRETVDLPDGRQCLIKCLLACSSG